MWPHDLKARYEMLKHVEHLAKTNGCHGIIGLHGVLWPSGLVYWTEVLGVARMWVRIPAWLVAALVSLSKDT